MRPGVRYGEAFWRAHHEAWRRSELTQREYCEAQSIPLTSIEFGHFARRPVSVEEELEPQAVRVANHHAVAHWTIDFMRDVYPLAFRYDDRTIQISFVPDLEARVMEPGRTSADFRYSVRSTKLAASRRKQ
jgi:hypothetical protein